MLYRSGAKKTKIQQINDAKKKKLVEKPKEPEQQTPLPADENVNGLIDGLAEEFRRMMTKLLAPPRERIENIPVPA